MNKNSKCFLTADELTESASELANIISKAAMKLEDFETKDPRRNEISFELEPTKPKFYKGLDSKNKP